MSFTYDECSTFLYILDKDYKSLFETANNHLLNSFFIWIISNSIGQSELALRLPNVIAFVLYLFYLFRILNLVKNRWVKSFGFLFLTVNPYLLDFFSLARGYGLAICFCLASVYYVIKYFNQTNDERFQNYRIHAIIFASLSVLSNLVLINFLIALLMIYFIDDIIQKRITIKNIGNWIRTNSSVIGFLILLTAILFPIVKILLDKHQLYHGGKNGFWQDTVNSLIESSFYFQTYNSFIQFSVSGFIFISLLLFGSFAFIELLKQKDMNIKSALLLILIFATAAPILQNIIFDSPLPLDRTALFYIILFGLFILFSLDSLVQISRWNFSLQVFILLLCCGLIFHFIKTANKEYTFNWKYDSNTKDAVNEMNKVLNGKVNEATIGIDWKFEPAIRYYRYRNNYGWLLATGMNYPWISKHEMEERENRGYDFYCLSDVENGGRFKSLTMKMIKHYKTSGSIIFARKIYLKKTESNNQ